jgi:hypothetical protein
MLEGSGSAPLTNGSRSRRPKNTRIRIHNTVPNTDFYAIFLRRLPAGNPTRHASVDQDGGPQHLRHFAEVLRQTVRGSARRKGRNGDLHPGRISLPDTPPSAEEGHQEQKVATITGQDEAKGGDILYFFIGLLRHLTVELGFFPFALNEFCFYSLIDIFIQIV